MKRLYILLFLCSVFLMQLKAQKICGSDEYYNNLMKTDPEFAKNQELLELATKEYIKSANLKSATTGIIYTIPVVVHVLVSDKWETIDNIKDDQIQSMIEVLNSDFQRNNKDKDKYKDTHPDYKDLQADCQIEFKLAKRDPNGNCTNGIVRYLHKKESYNQLLEDAKMSLLGGVDAWEASDYLNIWVVHEIKLLTLPYVAGYATFPGSDWASRSYDGLVIRNSEVGTIGVSIGLGRTATHEIGHWLNLKHIWGNSPKLISNCTDSDGVDDTPNQNGPNEECVSGIKKSCDKEPYGDMYMNYMDYTPDECMNMFTEGQKKRMFAAIESDPLRKSVVRKSNLALISPLADLTVINQDVSSTTIMAGDKVYAYFAEKNTGFLSANKNYVNIHLSSDAILTPGSNGDIYIDQYLVEQGVGPLSSSADYSKEITIPSDVVPGDYFLFFAADGTGLVDECETNNNFASVKITVTANNSLNPPRNLTAVAGDEQVTLSWLAPSSGIPSGYNIYRSSSEAGTYSLISSNLKTTSKTITGLTNGKTYWFYVQAVYATGERVASTKISAKPAISIKPANDDCSGAIILTSSVSCNYLENQTVNNATASGKSKGSCDGYTGTPALADVWYYFKAQSTSHTITVDPNGSQLDAVIVAYSSCSSNTGINCSDITGGPGTISTLVLSGLVPGDYYYIRVYDYGMQTTSGNFRICLTGEPANNSCIITSITPNSETHGPASFSTTPGTDDIYFNAQPNCSFEITNYCSWLTVSPMSGTTNNSGQAFLNYSIGANTLTSSREGIFYINGSPVTIIQNGEDGTDDDNDGVINSVDLCPNTPSGNVVNEKGCSDGQVITEVNNLQYYDVLLNTPKTKTIGLFNNGANDFTITSISITGENADQFSIAQIPPLVVSPDSYQNLEVTFNPTTNGAKVATIEIVTNAIEIPSKSITLNGTGVDQLNKILICMPSKTYNYGNIKIASSESKTFVIQNLGSDICTITATGIEGLNKDDFSITSQSELPSVLEVGEYFVVTVKFSPSSSGSKSAILNIANNSDNISPELPVELYGNGIIDVYSGNNNVVTAYEYWFDSDYSSKIVKPTFYEDVSELRFQFPTPNLENGLHSFHIRYLDKEGYWSSIASEFFHKLPATVSGTREINACEYWFDDDFANKISTEITPGQTITTNSGFDVSALQTGLHSYHVRYKDDAGQWSSVVSEFFHKLPVTATGTREITACEYWFDDDFANKISTEITPGQTITTNSGFDVSGLQTGLHSYHVRYKDDAGQWSSVVSEFFHKLPVTATGTREITACEFWFDDDFSNKISTEITPGQTITTNRGFDVSTLQTGLHSYHVRYKDDAGQWSSVVSEFFHKLPVTASGTREIAVCEYWFDDDFANKVSTEITPGQTITTNNGFDVSGLQTGLHSYHVRYKDDAGQWSSVVSGFFHKLPVTAAGSREITAFEYWFDDDFANKVSTEITPGQTITTNSGFDVSGLQTGLHSYHVRYKDDAGQWSSVVSQYFHKINLSGTGSNSISAYRYWFNNSFNNAVTVQLPSPVNPYELSGSISVSALPFGDHSLHFQFRDTRNAWSAVITDTFRVGSAMVQEIIFTTGWNISSAALSLAEKDMKKVFNPLIDKGSLFKIQDEAGNSVENWGVFGGWQNNIGDISPTEGYKIKVNRKDTLKITGSPVKYPFAIPLKKGWNIAGYPQMNDFGGMNLLQSLLDKGTLLKVQDDKGNSIEDWGIFGGWQNNIGNFTPGKGYKIKVNSNDTLWIYSNYPKSVASHPEESATRHFKTSLIGNGVDHMNINIVDLPLNIIVSGDELAVFDGAGCVGAVTIMPHHLQNQTVSISASASDDPGTPGFIEGNTFLLKLWKAKHNQEFNLEPEILKGTPTFLKHETTVASLQKYSTTGLEGINASDDIEINCYPNPFSDEVTVEINLKTEAGVAVEVLNQLGQRIETLEKGKQLNRGVHRFTWDGTNSGHSYLPTGIYIFRLKINGASYYRKVIYSK